VKSGWVGGTVSSLLVQWLIATFGWRRPFEALGAVYLIRTNEVEKKSR